MERYNKFFKENFYDVKFTFEIVDFTDDKEYSIMGKNKGLKIPIVPMKYGADLKKKFPEMHNLIGKAWDKVDGNLFMEFSCSLEQALTIIHKMGLDKNLEYKIINWDLTATRWSIFYNRKEYDLQEFYNEFNK
jgi:hypothetical protein